MELMTRQLLVFFLAALSVQASPLHKSGGDPDMAAQDAEVFYRPETPDSGPAIVPEKRWGGACLGCPPDPILISGRDSPHNPENLHHGNPDSGPREVPDSGPRVAPDSGRLEAPEKRWGGECLGCPPDPIILLGKRKRSE